MAGGIPDQPASDEVRRRAAEAETETRRLRWNKRHEIAQAEVDSRPRRKEIGSPSVSVPRGVTPPVNIGFRSRDEEQACHRQQVRTFKVTKAERTGSVSWVPRP